MLLSLAYRLVRSLFGLLAVLVRSDLSKDAELLVLRHDRALAPRPRRPQVDYTSRHRPGRPSTGTSVKALVTCRRCHEDIHAGRAATPYPK